MSDGLICAYLLNGQGGGKELSWEQIAEWKPDHGTLWIHLDYTHPNAKQWLLNESGLDSVTTQALTAEETRPRCVVTPDYLLLFLRSVNLNPGQDPEEMVSVRLWLSESKIISTRHRPLYSIHDIRENIKLGIGPKNASSFFIQLNNFINDHIGNVINDIEEELDNLEEDLQNFDQSLRQQLAEVRRDSIIMRRYLSPQREVQYRLQIEAKSWFNDTQQIHLRENGDRIIRYIEDLDLVRERVIVTQEELSSRVSEQINSKMLLLAIVAAIFLPLSFITGLLGMNLGGIPGAQSSYSFAFVSICLVVLGLLAIIVFRRKRWF